MSFPPPPEDGGGEGRGRHRGQGRGRGQGGPGQWRGRGQWRWRGNGGNGRRAPPVLSPPTTQNDNQSGQQRLTDMFEVVAGPYSGWKLYFQEEGFSEGSRTVFEVRAVEEFFRQNHKMFPHNEIRERQAATVDLKIITADENFIEAWPKFEEDLTENPEHTLACLGLALHQYHGMDLPLCIIGKALRLVLGVRKFAFNWTDSTVPSTLSTSHLLNNVRLRMQREIDGAEENTDNAIQDLPIINARPIGHQPVIQLQNLKTNCFGKLVTVRGTIIRVGSMKPAAAWMAFSCLTCKALQTVRQPQGIYTQPTKCRSDGCRSRMFAPSRSSQFTQTVNWQTIRVQEIAADEQREGGRVPRTVECELMEDLVDSAVPGDVVTITGIIRIHNSEESAARRKTASMFSLYLEAVSIVSNKGRGQTGGVGIEFNMKDYYAIQEIHAEPFLFRLLVHSLCPGIYGHELVKAGLLLGLVGGGASANGARNDPHILVVGDPGLGKSQMLQASAAVSPRGVYVCGNTSTASGLTVTLSREGHGDYALEAGALVLADQGCCCIDEFDKMSSQHQALLEAMEQQSISIAKAGVVCSLPARTSILSAANPVGGHYNRSKTIAENLRMGNALLSRFDLVFILMDKPNEHLDNLLTEHVMAAHSGLRKASELSAGNVSLPTGSDDYAVPLAERLRLYQGEHVNPIPPSMLRKYLAYARKYVVPRISEEGKGVLQQFYLELRDKYQSPDNTPVTNRQLQSLIRLTEARAKLEMREEATGQDAIDIVEMMRASLVDAFVDEMGTMHFNRSINGSGMSKRGKVKRFLAVLQRRADAMTRSTFNLPELKEVASTVGIEAVEFFDVLTSLNNQGCLLKKGPKVYQLLSVDH